MEQNIFTGVFDAGWVADQWSLKLKELEKLPAGENKQVNALTFAHECIEKVKSYANGIVQKKLEAKKNEI